MKLEVGVKVLIKNRIGQYLFIQRSEPLADGSGIRWDIPGGRINADEQLKEALAREAQEEIGVELHEPLKLINAQDIIVPDIELHVVRLTYTTQLDIQVALGNEHQNLKWAGRDESLGFNIDPYLRQTLEDL